ncbi:hypothetical protein M9H77_26128 [Catharanthus roseus]|uniref:Uncharacterized protein n=1 Tax=Catharanthus roseus TaxID=4058 RepID=A0ACC0AAM7_CATRO|nr:hypothetical protein M9H77_26128 [Catharanthus roseus]
MESSRPCKSCGERNLIQDDQTGDSVCYSCGVVQDFDNFQAHIGGLTGPAGTYVRVGTAGTGTVYSYKETKVYQAQKLIEDLIFKLGLSDARSTEVKAMVERVTEGEYGQGRWFTVFVGACAYVVMRRDNKMLPIVEVADLVGCDSSELGRMVNRVVNFLDLKMPEVDIVNLFKRSIKTCPSFDGISEYVIERMLKQGVFLVQCSMKWFLTTGRRPVPIVAAVLVFVAELNQLEVKIENVAKELHAAVHTCKKRYKEFLEILVKVAQVLPWGKDVTVKNILKNAPFVVQYMELKSMSKCSNKGRIKPVGIDVEDVIGDCLSKEISYAFNTNDTEKESQYFKGENSQMVGVEGPSDLQISYECLAMMYSKFLDEVSLKNSAAESGELNKRIRRRGYDLHACREWWTGKSGLSKELLLKQILEEDVGLDVNPPSFDKGQLTYERRRKKINAAKLRIQRIMHPSESGSANSDGIGLSESVNAGRKRRKMQVEIDWEDFIIETLLLHQVREDEIEKGHYNVLLELHVFDYWDSK